MKRRRKLSADQTRLRIVARPAPLERHRRLVVGLIHSGRLGASPKELAKELNIPIRSVQRGLHELKTLGEAMERKRGLWVCRASYYDITSDPYSILGFQNVRLVVRNWRGGASTPSGMPFGWIFRTQESGLLYAVCELGWEGRQVSLAWFPSTHVLTVWVSAKNLVPAGQAGVFKGWLDGTLGLTGAEEVVVENVEASTDHGTFRITPTYIEWRSFPDLAHVVYGMNDRLREEYRIARPTGDDGKRLSFRELVEHLVYASPLARAERMLKMELELKKAELDLAHRSAEGMAPARRDPTTVRPSDAAEQGFL